MFTKDEFQVMVQELLYTKPTSYDMLCRIAQKTLSPMVTYWCNTERCLRDRQYEQDILQEIYLRLMTTTVTRFLLPDGPNGRVNLDPEGFNKWMFTVAVNIKRDWVYKTRNYDFNTTELDGSSAQDISAEDTEDGEQYIEKLRAAFDLILSSGLSIYKILTWAAQFIFILEKDITKIQSNDEIIAAFEEKTLNEMYESIRSSGEKISWICITEAQDKKIKEELEKTWVDDKTYGEAKYKEFFMKKGGKKSISDWVNRLNDKVREEIDDEPSDDEPSDDR